MSKLFSGTQEELAKQPGFKKEKTVYAGLLMIEGNSR